MKRLLFIILLCINTAWGLGQRDMFTVSPSEWNRVETQNLEKILDAIFNKDIEKLEGLFCKNDAYKTFKEDAEYLFGLFDDSDYLLERISVAEYDYNGNGFKKVSWLAYCTITNSQKEFSVRFSDIIYSNDDNKGLFNLFIYPTTEKYKYRLDELPYGIMTPERLKNEYKSKF